MSELDELIEVAGNGDAEAQFQLAEVLRQANPPNYEQAAHWYRCSADQGHAEGQNALGTIYLNGLGQEPNPEEAVHWYRLAALQGEATALYNLATRYRTGEGVPIDMEECVALLTLAAEKGYMDAVSDLAVCFRFGQGVPRDILQATELFLVAAEEGDVVALGNLVDVREELQQLITVEETAQASSYLSRIDSLLKFPE